MSSLTTATDSLAAKIIRSKARAAQATGHNYSTEGRITGLCDAWEHLTGEDATEEALAEAAKRHNDAEAEQAARESAEGICASDIVTVGKGKTEWVVMYVDLYSTTIKSMTGHGAPTKRVENDTLTLVAKGPRTSDFYKG